VLVVRWLLVLTVLAVVVVGLVLGVRAIAKALSGDDDASPEAEQSAPAPDAETSEEPEPETTEPAECTPADVTVALTADAPAYALGQTAVFTLSITHVGTVPCTMDAGRTAAELVISSGADRIWSSADCEPGDPRLLLLDGGNSDVSTIEWATNRSAPECPADLPQIGAGTYQAVVTTPEITTEPVVFSVG